MKQKAITRNMSLMDRLLVNSKVNPETGCREWQGKRNEDGYGKLKDKGKEVRAHRAMFFLCHPDESRSLKVLHSCDNPPCIEDGHLFSGTQADNMADMRAKGRFRGGAKPGNKNAVGNIGWTRGGIVKQLGRVPSSKFGDEVELP